MTPRRILFLEASTGGVVGGSLTGILPLIAGLDRARFAPSLALFETKHLGTNGVPIRVLPPLPDRYSGRPESSFGRMLGRGRNLASLAKRTRALARLFRQERPALVYLANGVRANIDGVLAARLCSVPVICHEKGFEQLGAVGRFASRWIDACIGMTDEVSEHCRKDGVRARRLLTIYDGVDCAKFAPGGGAAVRRELGIPADVPVAGIVGHLQEWKGQHIVVEAIAQARTRFPELHCLLVGGVHRRGGEYAARLRARIAALGLERHVILTGARADVPACLDAMDIVLHSSITPEPFGRVMIEGMALGRPVIAPREGGPLAIVVDGQTGLLVPPRDADGMARGLMELLGDPARSRAMGRAARARVEAVFDIRHHVRAMESLFEELLAERGTAAGEAS